MKFTNSVLRTATDNRPILLAEFVPLWLLVLVGLALFFTDKLVSATNWIRDYDLAGNTTADYPTNGSPQTSASGPSTSIGQPGNSVSFTAGVSGAVPFSYQWQFNGTNIAGATNESFLTPIFSTNLAGTYAVVVSNNTGLVTNRTFTLSLDTDRDLLPDTWETTYFGNLTKLPADDPDSDGVSNCDEFIDETNPNNGTSYKPRLTLLTTSGGSVSASPLKSKYNPGEVVQITATPDAGKSFTGWFGNTNSTANPLSLALNNSKSITAQFGLALDTVLDTTNLTWTTSSNAPWYGQSSSYYSSPGAAQSAILTNGQQSWIQTTVSASNTLKVAFQWYVNSETNRDYFTFYTNNVQAVQISGVIGWQEKILYLPAGTHTLRWTYAKDASDNTPSLDLARLDRVQVSTPYAFENGNTTLISWGDTTTVPSGLTNVVAIAAGYFQRMALLSDGTVTSWGNSSAPPDLSNVVAIAAGSYHSLALRSDGSLVAWGSNGNGQTNIPNGLTSAIGIACGESHCLALKPDGTVIAWGYNANGRTNVPVNLSNVVAVAAGYAHSLALRGDGTVASWGLNTYGQTNVPAGLTNVIAIAGGLNHSVALRADGTVIAWGQNTLGQTNVPAGLTNVAAITTGDNHNLALLKNGTVVGWGYDYYGQATSLGSLTNVIGIAGGGSESLALIGDPARNILKHPSNVTAYEGQPVSFYALARGLPALAYQWRLNGTNIVGETNAWIRFAAVQTSNAGNYSVVVSNLFGSVVSSNAALVVSNALPMLLAQPTSQPFLRGGNATLSVSVIGSSPFNYQWRFNGTNIVGATNATFTVTNVQPENYGGYSVAVSNIYGGTISSNVTLPVASSLVVAWGENSYGQTNVPPGLANVTSISAGGSHTLTINVGGTVVSWGNNSEGQTSVPASVSNVVGVAAGTYRSLAVKTDGTVAAWGRPIDMPSELTNVATVAPGYNHVLALLNNGTVFTWGDNTYGQTNVPPGISNAISVAAGLYHSLALLDNGTAVAWGYNANGRTNIPSGLSNIVAIAAGDQHNLALKADGTVTAWGYNGSGQTTVPAGLSNVVAIAAGADNSFALRPDGTLVGWGYNGSSKTTAPALATNIFGISAGGNHTVALLGDGSARVVRQPINRSIYSGTSVSLTVGAVGLQPLAYQWQFNGTNLPSATNALLTIANTQLADAGVYCVTVSNVFGSTVSSNATLVVSNSAPILLAQPFTAPLLRGANATFSAAASGSGPLVYQWRLNGTNISGATNAVLTLTNVQPGNVGMYSLVVSNDYGFAVSSNTLLPLVPTLIAAWGDNGSGQTNVPPGLTNIIDVSAGQSHNLALKSDGTIVAWGDNSQGQTNSPPALNNVVGIAAGLYHNLAIQTSGTVVAWGRGYEGQTNIPAGLSNVNAVAAGRFHSLALKADGTVAAWGQNSSGQTNVPAGLVNLISVAAGYAHNLCLRDDGTVAAWGDNAYSQTNVPVGLSNVVAIAAGDYHNIGLKQDGTVVAWGNSGNGRTTVPAGLSNVVAISAGSQNSFALRSDGTAVGWGYNGSGQTTIPVVVTNVFRLDGGAGHTIALLGDGAARIVRQPINQFTYSGRTATLTIGAAGLQPLTYQWQLNGTNLPSATNALLTVTNTQLANAGIYSVLASNIYGSVVSSNAMLTVSNAPPFFLVQPSATPLLRGGNANFTALISGSLPVSYQWQFNGTNIVGATNLTLTITNVQLPNVGNYTLVASNAYGYTISSNAPLPIIQTAVVAWGNNGSGQTNVPINLTNVISVIAGSQHNLVLKQDGTVVAWGQNGYGQTDIPAGLTNVIGVAGGIYFSLALKSDGKVVGWGYNGFGQTTIPTGLANVEAIAAGYSHGLALKHDGTVEGWGRNDSGQTDIPTGLSNVVAIAAGGDHSFALRRDGTLIGWGVGNNGQTNVPSGLSNVLAIACGPFHNVALKSDRTVLAWGTGFTVTNVPVGLSNIVAITAGLNFSFALKQDGTIIGWGSGPTAVPVGVTNIVGFDGGDSHMIALINDGTPFFLGPPVETDAHYGEAVTMKVSSLGVGPLRYQWQFNGTNIMGATNASFTIDNAKNTDAGNYDVVVSNDLGSNSTTAVNLITSPVMAWGYNGHGETTVPAGLGSVTKVVGGGVHSLVVKFNETVAAWGDNAFGETSVPLSVTNVLDVDAGDYHSLTLKKDGTVVAWGYGANGETEIPSGVSNVIAISAGDSFNVALRKNGTLAAWGFGGNGETNIPPDLVGVTAVAAGGFHSLALRTDGSVGAWGWNGFGETDVPGGSSNVVAVAAGEYHSVALKDNGSVLSWGDNSYGQTNIPDGLSNVVAIAAGKYHTLALRGDGNIFSWGLGADGQTAVPLQLSNAIAIGAGANHSLALLRDFGDAAPKIVRQPENRSVYAGQALILNVGAVGAAPLSYHWQHNGTNLIGATNTSLRLENLSNSQGGFYQVSVSNAFGSVTSTLVVLSITSSSPTIVVQPISQVVSSFSSADFAVGVLGSSPLRYQWRFDGYPILNATNSSYRLLSAIATNSGSYDVVVSNTLGGVTSVVASLTVVVPTFTVTNTNDNGAGSFRQAIQDANSSQGQNHIVFNIPGTGPFTIKPTTALPYITNTVVIDGYTQLGSSTNTLEIGNDANLLIELTGLNASDASLHIGGSNCVVRGLVINRSSSAGIVLYGSGGCVVEGNRIGTDVSGSLPQGNSCVGISISSANNLIGGTLPSARNIVSGNGCDGIYVGGSSATNNSIQGNYIGLSASGVFGISTQTANGIRIDAPSNWIGGETPGAGNIVGGHSGNGITLTALGGNGNIVRGNFIGVSANGLTKVANLTHGINLGGSANTVGGTNQTARNIISGNGVCGIGISSASSNNIVLGNWIGLDSSGTNGLGNNSDGIMIDSSALNTIGGSYVGAGNVISSNQGNGLNLRNPGATGNLIQGNWIGTDASGTKGIGNRFNGIVVGNTPVGQLGPSNNIIGGDSVLSRNVISANGAGGINFNGQASANTTIGNYIGTDITGTNALGNKQQGIWLGNVTNITIGGTSPGKGNLIAFNLSDAIRVSFNGPPQQIAIRGNAIYNNGGSGIDLNSNGVTPNDAGDADSGANRLQNFPIVSNVRFNGVTTIDGTLNSSASASFMLDFYASPVADPSGHGEGARFLGSHAVNTDGSGNTSFSVILTNSVGFGDFVTATATDTNGNTSEFGGAFQVVQTPPFITQPPANCVFAVGESNFLGVVAIGGTPLGYQWQFNSVNILGATGTVIALSNVQFANAGRYSVVVSNANGVAQASAWLTVGMNINTVKSGTNFILNWSGPYMLQTATNVQGPYQDMPGTGSPFTNLIGLEPKRFFRLRSTTNSTLSSSSISNNNQFTFNGSGIPGYNYVVEASTNLHDWLPLLTNSVPFGYAETNAPNYPARFYRTRLFK